MLTVACLAAGCGGAVSSALSNLPTPSRTITATGRPATPASPAASATTAAPTTAVTNHATPAQSASPVASATAGTGSGTSLLWVWILLGVAVLAGLIAWATHARRRHTARAADWRSRIVDVYAEGAALHDAISAAEGLNGPAGDVSGRWADIQRRADDLTQTLYALREAAADPVQKVRIADVLASLQAVRSAIDAQRVPGRAGPAQAETVRSRLFDFEVSLRALRGADQGYS